jgi:hypothetical protein
LDNAIDSASKPTNDNTPINGNRDRPLCLQLMFISFFLQNDFRARLSAQVN